MHSDERLPAGTSDADRVRREISENATAFASVYMRMSMSFHGRAKLLRHVTNFPIPRHHILDRVRSLFTGPSSSRTLKYFLSRTGIMSFGSQTLTIALQLGWFIYVEFLTRLSSPVRTRQWYALDLFEA